MTPTKASLLGLTVLAAASVALNAAQACGPMQGGSPAQGAGPSQGAASRGGASPGGFGGGASQGGGGGGGWDNAGAEQLRQGADAATRGDGGDDGESRRAPSNATGAASQNYTNQISTLGAAEAKDAPAQNSYDGTRAGGDSLESIKNDWAVSEAMMNGGYITDAWKTWNDLPWWQKYGEDEPLKYRAGAPKISPTDGFRPDPPAEATGGPSVWGLLAGGELEHSLKPPTPAPPVYEDPAINPAWKAWNDLPWYSKLTTEEPPHQRPTGAPSHAATPHAGARG